MYCFQKFVVFVIFIACNFFMSGCKKNALPPEDSPEVLNNIAENTWVYKQMKSIYLWEDKMPQESKTNKKLSPDKYFSSILDRVGEFDRVSYMKIKQEDLIGQLTGNLKSFGFRYIKFFTNEAKKEIALAVSLVYTGSSAETAGLKRGDIITKIDSKTIRTDNVDALLETDKVNFELSEYNKNGQLIQAKSLAINATQYQIDPLHYGNIYEKGDRKIAYLVYNQFLIDFDNQFRNTIGFFKNKNINEFILDLRFNPGGFTPSAEVVGSLLVKNLRPNTEMYHGEWNIEQTKFKLEKEGKSAGYRNWTDEPNNLKTLDRIYILTSKSTSSSSELLINSLLPFMEVIIVGENTFGKNVISQIIIDEDKKINLGLLPAYCKTYNVNNQSEYGTKDGFVPKIKVKDNVFPLLPLGDPKESFLAAALNDISSDTLKSARRKVVFTKTAKLVDQYQHLDHKSIVEGHMYVNFFKK